MYGPHLNITLTDARPHTLEVISRDGWANVDATPDTLEIALAPAAPSWASGCSTSPRHPHDLAWLMVLPALVGLRRRSGASR